MPTQLARRPARKRPILSRREAPAPASSLRLAAAVGRGPVEAPAPTVSYANPDDPALRRLLIRAIELGTGQPKLKRMYLNYRQQGGDAANFWAEAVRRLGLRLRYDPERLAALSLDGPLVIVSNHPYGVIDGIVIGYLTSLVRPRFKLLSHSVLYRAPELQSYLLPVDFTETRQAIETNLETRRRAQAELDGGGAVVVFPAGRVSTARRAFGIATDSAWKPFTASLIMRSRATVVPIFFEGQNSRMFQIFGQFSETLREALLLKEVAGRIDTDVGIRIGAPIPYAGLAHIRDRGVLIEHLRDLTLTLPA